MVACLSFRGGASCTVPSAPRPSRAVAPARVKLSPGPLCRPLPAPRQRGDGCGGEMAAGRCLCVLALLPLTWDLRVLPLWEFCLCAEFGSLCRWGPTRLQCGGVQPGGVSGLLPQVKRPCLHYTPPRGLSEPRSHRRGAPGVCSPSSVHRRPCPLRLPPSLAGRRRAWSPAAFPHSSALQTLGEAGGYCGRDAAQL